MAVLSEGGNWTTFSMELDNRAHRAAFFEGRVPAGAAIYRANTEIVGEQPEKTRKKGILAFISKLLGREV
jgi:tRNA(Arg) A34 adenosine deaminase TadA